MFVNRHKDEELGVLADDIDDKAMDHRYGQYLLREKHGLYNNSWLPATADAYINRETTSAGYKNVRTDIAERIAFMRIADVLHYKQGNVERIYGHPQYRLVESFIQQAPKEYTPAVEIYPEAPAV